MNRPRPEVGDGSRAISITGIETRQILFGLAFNPLAPFADFIGEAPAVFGDVFQDDLVKQHRQGVEVAGKGVCSHTQCFKWNRAAAGERVHDERTSARGTAKRLVRSLGERAAGFEVFADGGIVPIGKVGDEIQQPTAQLGRFIKELWILPGLLESFAAFRAEKPLPVVMCPLQHQFPHPFSKRCRTIGISRVKPECRANYRPTRRQRTPRPPYMQRGNVPVPDGLFPPRVRRDALDRQINFDEAFGIRNHFFTFNGAGCIKNLFYKLFFLWSDRGNFRQFFVNYRLAIYQKLFHVWQRNVAKFISGRPS